MAQSDGHYIDGFKCPDTLTQQEMVGAQTRGRRHIVAWGEEGAAGNG